MRLPRGYVGGAKTVRCEPETGGNRGTYVTGVTKKCWQTRRFTEVHNTLIEWEQLIKKKIESAVVEQLEAAYGSYFNTVEILTTTKIAGKTFLELTCNRGKDERFVVSYAKKLWGSDMQNMEDSYIQSARKREIEIDFDRQIRPTIGTEFKVIYSPGSTQKTGTYSNSTPISTILANLDEFDEFFVLATKSVPLEATENLKLQLKESGYKVTVHISGLVDAALYNSITGSYYEENDPSSAGRQFYSLYFDEGEYVTAES